MDFIYKNNLVFSKEICKQWIDAFEESNLKSLTDYNSKVYQTKVKKSTDILFDLGQAAQIIKGEEHLWVPLLNNLVDILQKEMDKYMKEYPEIDLNPTFTMRFFNIQKYLPGEGFYEWHNETSQIHVYDRIFAWMIYLNDIDDGGTEFKYFGRETAETGKLLIWPAGWTHTHRGQISNTKTKYILTGWFTLVPPSN